ncbi:hypothetical protein Tco_0594131 [Tanacetum coccineum]
MGILYKSMEGAQGDHEDEVFQVSNDDTVVAQRRLEDKQPEEKTNTDCLVKEQEKEYQTGWNIKTVIMEYLVNISKRRAFWSLNEDILKITILTTNTPYPSRKIRRICACTHQRPRRPHDQYAVSREDQYAVLEI